MRCPACGTRNWTISSLTHRHRAHFCEAVEAMLYTNGELISNQLFPVRSLQLRERECVA